MKKVRLRVKYDTDIHITPLLKDMVLEEDFILLKNEEDLNDYINPLLEDSEILEAKYRRNKSKNRNPANNIFFIKDKYEYLNEKYGDDYDTSIIYIIEKTRRKMKALMEDNNSIIICGYGRYRRFDPEIMTFINKEKNIL